MNELQIFKNPDFGQVRVVNINGEAWLVGSDVATALGYTNPAKAIRDHVYDEDKLTERFVLSGQNREVIVINESGVYSLIFSSKLPTAKKFKHWVTSEVLPSIRKTGGYKVEKPMDDMEVLCRAVLISDKRIKALENKIELDAPKVAYADYGSASKDSVLIRDFCYGLP